jgi:hypothetical protein
MVYIRCGLQWDFGISEKVKKGIWEFERWGFLLCRKQFQL